MLETLDKLMAASVGAVTMTRQAAEQLFDEWVRLGRAKREERTGFVDQVMESAEQTRRDLREFVDRQVRETVARLNLATRDDLARIEAKIDQLLGQKKRSTK